MLSPLYRSIGPLGRAFGRAAAALSSLLDGLVHAWPLNEPSGTRYDVVGTAHLTDNNTVGAAPGMHNDAANLIAVNSEWLSIAATPTPVGSDWSWSFWYKDTGENYGSVIGDAQDGLKGWVLFTRNNGTVDLYCYPGPKIINVAAANGAWHHAYVELVAATKVVSISIDNAALVSDTLASPYADANFPFKIGKSDLASYLTGLVDEAAVWSRVLTDDERAELLTKFYPFEE